MNLQEFPDEHNDMSFNPAAIHCIGADWEEEIIHHLDKKPLCAKCMDPIILLKKSVFFGCGKIKMKPIPPINFFDFCIRHQHVSTETADEFPANSDTSDIQTFQDPSGSPIQQDSPGFLSF